MGARCTTAIEWDIPTFVRSVAGRLHRAGHQAYVVGGAVRDLCMGRPATDWDITTSASPEEIAVVFKDLRSFSLKHETVTLVHKGRHYEVTTFRGPKQTLEDDLQHRDFTINAMAYDMGKSAVLDPRGGRRDIKKRVVRGVVRPEERFREDPLRLIRAVRFAVELDFQIEGKTLKAISSMAETITTAAPERIRDEMIRILVCERPSLGLQLLNRTGLLGWILPEFVDVEKAKGRVVDQAAPDAALRLSALFCAPAESPAPDHGTKSDMAAKSIMVRLCFGKSMIRQVGKLVEEERALAGYDSSWGDGDLRRLIRRVGAENLESLVGLRKANLASLAKGNQEPLRRLKEFQSRIKGLSKTPLVRGVQDLAIDGSKVMEITGLSPGPEVGRILKHLSEELMDHPEWNTRAKLMAMLKKMKFPALLEHPEVLGEIHRTAGGLKTRAQTKS
jgi:tRNA nucleotidyltransferase (CCA-adding enzyme)